jgi:hypothetical protein|tara:strand:+ start:7463 stop:7720 length:258 start_codon:yes stop_codon:yes gene_type:complete
MSETLKTKKRVQLFGAGSKELVKFLDNKLEQAQSGSLWFWLQGIYKVEQYLDEDGTLDEIMMQGEFNEEITIVKEWIEEWKQNER